MAGIFKAYDVRGIYPTELDETTARKIGQAFRNVLDDEDLAFGHRVVVSRTCGRRPCRWRRLSSRG
jgi:phosphomannomutase